MQTASCQQGRELQDILLFVTVSRNSAMDR
jgi:hypothetical protein